MMSGSREMMPGSGTSSAPAAMRGPMVGANGSPPAFRTYNECRTWLARMTPEEGSALDRATVQGEITMADRDPCQGLPSS